MEFILKCLFVRANAFIVAFALQITHWIIILTVLRIIMKTFHTLAQASCRFKNFVGCSKNDFNERKKNNKRWAFIVILCQICFCRYN